MVNFEEIEDEDTKEALDKVRALCAKNKFDEAVKSLPEIDFEFDADAMDSDPSDYFTNSKYSFTVNPKAKSCSIKAGLEEGNLILSIAVVFEIEVSDGIDVDEFNEWLSDNGGWSAGTAAGSWGYSADDGGDCLVV